MSSMKDDSSVKWEIEGKVRLEARRLTRRTLQSPCKEVMNPKASPVGWLNKLPLPTPFSLASRLQWLEKLRPACLLPSFLPFTSQIFIDCLLFTRHWGYCSELDKFIVQ